MNPSTDGISFILAMVMALGAVAIAGLVFAGYLVGRHLHDVRCRVICPATGESTDCVVVQDARTSEWTGVFDCSRLVGPQSIHCKQECLGPLNLRSRAGEGSALATARNRPAGRRGDA